MSDAHGNTSTDPVFDDTLNQNLIRLGWHDGISEEIPDELLEEAIAMTEKQLGRERTE